MDWVLLEEMKNAVGYKDPGKKTCENCFFSAVHEGKFYSEDNSYYRNINPPVMYCLYLAELFRSSKAVKKRFSGRVSFFTFEVDPKGACGCFKKKPVRCPYYNQQVCARRNCQDTRYDNDCMEVVV